MILYCLVCLTRCLLTINPLLSKKLNDLAPSCLFNLVIPRLVLFPIAVVGGLLPILLIPFALPFLIALNYADIDRCAHINLCS